MYSDTDPAAPSADDRRGFLRDQRGRFTTIHVPGAVQTQAFGINNRGQVVGEYLDADGTIHGFLWDKGRFTTIDGPDGAVATATNINDRARSSASTSIPPRPGTSPRRLLLSKGDYTHVRCP